MPGFIYIIYAFPQEILSLGFQGVKSLIQMPKSMRKLIGLNTLVVCIILLRYTQGNECIS